MKLTTTKFSTQGAFGIGLLVMALVSIFACAGMGRFTSMAESVLQTGLDVEKALVSTPRPKPTPTKSPYLTPAVIEDAKAAMTDLAFNNFCNELVDHPILFDGGIIEVHTDGRVQLRGPKVLTAIVVYGVPLDVAATLQKNQYMVGVGRVRDVSVFLGLQIRVDVVEYEVK